MPSPCTDNFKGTSATIELLHYEEVFMIVYHDYLTVLITKWLAYIYLYTFGVRMENTLF